MLNTGDKFGRLTVVKEVESDYGNNGRKYRKYLCICECGNYKEVREPYLTNGYTKSCGCLNNESRNKGRRKNRFNEFIIENNIVYVKMSNSESIMTCDVDIWETAKLHTWHLDDHGYAASRINGKIERFHVYYFGEYGKIIDHIDRNKLNNLRENIRNVDYVTNSRNVNKRKNNTTGYKGVSYDYRKNKYYAYINISPYKRKFLGYYDTPEEANEARLKAEEEYYTN